MLLAACVCADFYEILPKDPKTGSLKLLSATSYDTRVCGGLNMTLFWNIFWLIPAYMFILIPFSTFYYEADDGMLMAGTNTAAGRNAKKKSRIWDALKCGSLPPWSLLSSSSSSHTTSSATPTFPSGSTSTTEPPPSSSPTKPFPSIQHFQHVAGPPLPVLPAGTDGTGRPHRP